MKEQFQVPLFKKKCSIKGCTNEYYNYEFCKEHMNEIYKPKIVNDLKKKYFQRGKDSSYKLNVNEFIFSENESDLHCKRKLVIALNFYLWFCEAQRNNIAHDEFKKFPYRNSNGMGIVRDLVCVWPLPGVIHECETCIGHGSAETYTRFLNPLPLIARGKPEYGPNTENIRDPDFKHILVHLYLNNKWGIYYIRHKQLFNLNDNSVVEYFNKIYNTNFNISRGSNIELSDERIKLLIKADINRDKIYVSSFKSNLNLYSITCVFNLINNNGILEAHKSHRKFYEEYNLEFKPIKQICNYSNEMVPVDKLEFYAGKRIVDDDIKFDNSRIADLGQELINEYNNLK